MIISFKWLDMKILLYIYIHIYVYVFYFYILYRERQHHTRNYSHVEAIEKNEKVMFILILFYMFDKVYKTNFKDGE